MENNVKTIFTDDLFFRYLFKTKEKKNCDFSLKN